MTPGTSPVADTTGDPPGGDAPMTIATAETAFAAQLLVAALREAGMPAEALETPVGTEGPWSNLRPARVPIVVRAADEVRAVELLRDRAGAFDDVDWDAVELGARDDDLPLTPPGRKPLAARLAFGIAVFFIVLIVVLGITSALW